MTSFFAAYPAHEAELELLLTRHFPQDAPRVLDCSPGPPERVATFRTMGAQRVVLLNGPAELAGQYDAVLQEDLLSSETQTHELFDYVLCHDLLPRLPDSEPVLKKLHKLIAPEGRLLATVPNLQNHRSFMQLVEGSWEHEEFGPLARPHIRFYTGSELFRLLQKTGFSVERTSSLRADAFQLFPRDADKMIRRGRIQIGPLSDDEYKQFIVRDYAFLAKPQRP